MTLKIRDGWNEPTTDDQFKTDVLRWFHELRISEKLERQLYKVFLYYDKIECKGYVKLASSNPEVLNVNAPYEERARAVWSIHETAREKLEFLCHLFGISSRYYRELRNTHEPQW